MPSIHSFPNIFLAGKMGSGKTTICNYLIEQYGYTHLSFAKALKNIEKILQKHSAFFTLLYVAFNYYVPFLKYWTLYKLLRKTKNIPIEYPKARKRLQFLGNSIRDSIDSNFWVSIAIKEMRELQAHAILSGEPMCFVFDDARYLNEIEILKQNGFIDVLLECSDFTRMRRLGKLYGITDRNDPRLFAPSETEMEKAKFTYTVINDETMNPYALSDVDNIVLKVSA